MKNLPLRRVLECVSEEYKTAKEIASIHSRRYPLTLEFILSVSSSLRRRAFNEKETGYKPKSVQIELDILVAYGYVKEDITDFFRKKLPRKTTFYKIDDRGRLAILSVKSKKGGL